MRMNYAHKRFPKKKAVNLSLSEELIDTAKELKINLSELTERKIGGELRALKIKKWAEKNATAIAERNERVKKNGLLSDWMWGKPDFADDDLS